MWKNQLKYSWKTKPILSTLLFLHLCCRRVLFLNVFLNSLSWVQRCTQLQHYQPYSSILIMAFKCFYFTLLFAFLPALFCSHSCARMTSSPARMTVGSIISADLLNLNWSKSQHRNVIKIHEMSFCVNFTLQLKKRNTYRTMWCLRGMYLT